LPVLDPARPEVGRRDERNRETTVMSALNLLHA
jgi:hypothetical protein